MSELKTNSPGYQERYTEIFEVIQDWGMDVGIEMSPATASSLCHRLVRESLSRRAPTEAAKPEAGLSEEVREALKWCEDPHRGWNGGQTFFKSTDNALQVLAAEVRRLSKATPSAVSEAKSKTVEEVNGK